MLGCFEILEQVEHIWGYGSPILPTVSVQTSLASQVFTFFKLKTAGRESGGEVAEKVFLSQKYS